MRKLMKLEAVPTFGAVKTFRKNRVESFQKPPGVGSLFRDWFAGFKLLPPAGLLLIAFYVFYVKFFGKGLPGIHAFTYANFL